jgi:sec-independent protein translocase protein TatB
VFGLSFGEIVLLLVVGIVVVGPKNLPTMMRTAGRWVGKLRRMSSDLRSQSGIDDLIRQEGLEREIAELRSLSRVNVIETLMTTATAAPSTVPSSSTAIQRRSDVRNELPGIQPLREREYPLIGCDAYGALPDDATPYRPPPRDEIPEDERAPGNEEPANPPAPEAAAVGAEASSPEVVVGGGEKQEAAAQVEAANHAAEANGGDVARQAALDSGPEIEVREELVSDLDALERTSRPAPPEAAEGRR